MPWYPNSGAGNGLDWWDGLLSEVPTMPKDTRNKLYPRFLKNWRNASSYWYSQNPTSYTPEYTDEQVGSMRNINRAQTGNVNDVVEPRFRTTGLHNAPADRAVENKLASNQQADMAQSESVMRNAQERQRYEDWLRWVATASERKDTQDELNIAKENLAMQNEIMNRQPDQGGTDWMSVVNSGLGMLGGMTQPYMAQGQMAQPGDPYGNWNTAQPSVFGNGMEGMKELGSAAWKGIGSGLNWLSGLI
jgi:hypothetical protein